MGKCDSSYHQAIKVNVRKKRDMHAQKELQETFDIRDKRIGIVFKILYVVAAFFAAAFKLMADGMRKGLEVNHILYSCFAAFLFCLLVKMIIYVFNELKCLKIGKSVGREQIRRTEKSYSALFDFFCVGGITTIIAGGVLESIKHLVTQDFVAYMFVFGLCITVSAFLGGLFKSRKCKRFCAVATGIGWLIVLVALFIASGIPVGEKA